MGSWDVYCAICGMVTGEYTPLRYVDQDDLDSDDGDPPDHELLQRNGLEWIVDNRIIGINRHQIFAKRGFITGAAVYDDGASFDIEDVGDYPDRVPTSNRSASSPETLQVFQGQNFPIHHVCLYNIFSRVLATRIRTRHNNPGELLYGLNKNIDPDLFVKACLAIDYVYLRRMKLDYGAQSHFVGQRCPSFKKGFEDLWSDPGPFNPQIMSYLSKPPKLHNNSEHEDQQSGHATGTSEPDPSSDIFARLPLEIVINIMRCLDRVSFYHLRLASRTVSLVRLSNLDWRLRLLMDAPWLIELDPENHLMVKDQDRDLDWRQIYQDIHQFSDRSSPKLIHQLANRRRIWRTCNLIADVYVREARKEISERHQYNPGDCPDLQYLSESAQIALPGIDGQDKLSDKYLLVSCTEDISGLNGSLNITDRWIDPDSNLIEGMSFLFQKGSVEKQTHIGHGHPSQFPEHKPPYITVPPGDWIIEVELFIDKVPWDLPISNHDCTVYGGIVGIIFRTLQGQWHTLGSSIGQRVRVLRAPAGHLIAGFQIERYSGRICSFGILHSQSVDAAMNRISPKSAVTAGTWIGRPPPDEMIRTHRYFPFHESLHGFHVDYTAHPFEFLAWSQTDTSKATLARIGIDAYLRGFQMELTDGSAKSIGRCAAMKYLELDVKGGERLESIWTNFESACVCLVTSMGRQIFAGNLSSATHRSWQRHIDPSGYNFCGIYAAFSRLGAADLGPLFLPSRSSHNSKGLYYDKLTRDSDERLVEPSSWPEQWKEDGRILGFGTEQEFKDNPSWTQHNRKELHAASWLDLTKPIQHVRVFQCHTRLGYPVLAIVGLVLTYSDGAKASAGLQWLSDKDTRKDSQYYDPDDMDCGCGFRVCDYKDATGPMKEAHFAEYEWSVSNERISEVHVWGPSSVDGIKFVIPNRKEAIQLGRCSGEPTGKIVHAEGLKVLFSDCVAHMEHYRNDYAHRDSAIAGLQALRCKE